MFYLKRLSNSNFKCISFQYIRAVTSNLVIIVILCNNLLSHFVTPVTLSNKFRLTCHPLQWFLSQFPIIFLKFVNLSPFVTLCDKFFQKGQKSLSEVFWSLFVIKTVIAKNWDSVHIFTSQKRYSKSFLLFYLSEYSDYVKHVKHTNISRTNQNRISHLGIFRPFLVKLSPKNQNCLSKMLFSYRLIRIC